MKSKGSIPEAVVRVVKDGTAPKGKTFITAATVMAFGAPDAFNDLSRALSGPGGVAQFKKTQATKFSTVLESLCVLSLSAGYALAQNGDTLQSVLVPKDAPTDMEFISEGPEPFTRYMMIQEARKSLLHEIISAYFHETGHAVVAAALGATPRMVVRFKPIFTDEGIGITSEQYGCSAERDTIPEDAEQAVLTLGGVMFELLGPLHLSLAPLVEHLLGDHDFWIKLLHLAADGKEPEAGLQPSAELMAKTLWGAGGDSRHFFGFAPTRDLQVAAIDRCAAILRPLMDKGDGGKGCETFADTTLAAINHFTTLDAINADMRDIMRRYASVPTFGLYGDEEQREHAREVSKEAKAELDAEAAADAATKKGTQ